MSMVDGSTPARSMACWPASTASVPVDPPKRRSRMPVRSTIHSSVVSRRDAKSALVTIFSGRAAPQPRTAMPISSDVRSRRRGRARRDAHGSLASSLPSAGPQPGDGLAGGDPLAVDGDEPHEVPREQRPDLDGADGAEEVADLDATLG